MYISIGRVVAIGILEIFALAVIGFMVYYGFQKQEVVDCLTWQRQAANYPDFYLVEWQKKQCDAHGIPIEFVRVIKN